MWGDEDDPARREQKRQDELYQQGWADHLEAVRKGHEDYAASKQRQAEHDREWDRREKAHQAYHERVREREQQKINFERHQETAERWSKPWSSTRETKSTDGGIHFGQTPCCPYRHGGSAQEGISQPTSSWLSALGRLLGRALAGIFLIFVLPVAIIIAMKYIDPDKRPTVTQPKTIVDHGRTSPPPQASTCNVGNYTANSGTLHLFTPEINTETGEIFVNGVDTAGPTIPFRFIWGDGTVTVGWFPQRKIYKKRPYTSAITCYQVWVVAKHQDGLLARAAIAVSP